MPGKKDIVPVTNLKCQNVTSRWGGDRRAPSQEDRLRPIKKEQA